MESAPFKKQKSLSQILLICVVLLIVVMIGIFLMRTTMTQIATKKSITKICLYDEHVCTFLTKLNNPQQFYNEPITATISLTSTNTVKGKVILQADMKNNVYATLSQNGKPSGEILVIGSMLYKKDPEGVWQEQQNLGNNTVTQFRTKAFQEVNKSGKDISYMFINATSPCDIYTCMQYQLMAPTLGKNKEFVFFDTKNYLLRKTVTQTPEGNITETSFAYTPLTITLPPTKL